MIVKLEHKSLKQITEDAYNLGEPFSTEHDIYHCFDEDGKNVWESIVFLRECPSNFDNSQNYIGYESHKRFVYFDCLFLYKKFMESVERQSRSLVDDCVKFAERNNVDGVEIKFMSEIPVEVEKSVRNYKKPDVEYMFLGYQWLRVMLKK